MAFKTKSEKKAFRIGLLRGLFRKKKGARKKVSGGKRNKHGQKALPSAKIYKKKSKAPLRVNRNRYRVDTYVEDGVDNNRYVVHSFSPTLKGAGMEAAKVEKYERNTYDHSMLHIDSAISKVSKRYRKKKN